jgi:hypothetical protein
LESFFLICFYDGEKKSRKVAGIILKIFDFLFYMTWAAVPAAVFADAVLGRVDDNVGFHFFRHPNGVRTPFRFRVLDVIARNKQIKLLFK